MDLLFKRYASPFLFMGGMILAGRFEEFVDDFVLTINRETEHENQEKEMRFHWECWLHRIFDKSFKEYMDEIKTNEEHQNMSQRTIETTYQHSMDILNKFNPETEGGE